MRLSGHQSRFLRQAGPALTVLLLSAGPALAGSWSSTMQVSATVVSSCTLVFNGQMAASRVRSACSRGEQPLVSRTTAPAVAAPPPAIAEQHGPGSTTYLVVTY